jgi:hypothetical protein
LNDNDVNRRVLESGIKGVVVVQFDVVDDGVVVSDVVDEGVDGVNVVVVVDVEEDAVEEDAVEDEDVVVEDEDVVEDVVVVVIGSQIQVGHSTIRCISVLHLCNLQGIEQFSFFVGKYKMHVSLK